ELVVQPTLPIEGVELTAHALHLLARLHRTRERCLRTRRVTRVRDSVQLCDAQLGGSRIVPRTQIRVVLFGERQHVATRRESRDTRLRARLPRGRAIAL